MGWRQSLVNGTPHHPRRRGATRLAYTNRYTRRQRASLLSLDVDRVRRDLGGFDHQKVNRLVVRHATRQQVLQQLLQLLPAQLAVSLQIDGTPSRRQGSYREGGVRG